MVLHFKRWLAVQRHADGGESPLVLFNVKDEDEAKEEVAKRIRARIAEGVFDEETSSDEVSTAGRTSGNNKRERLFFIANINNKREVVAEIRRRNKKTPK